MIKLRFLAGVCAAALLAASTPALAQHGGDQLQEVVVEGQGGDSATGPVDGYVAKDTRTGSKTATPVKEVPQAVSVVGRDEIDDQGAQKVDEALRYTAGVFTQPFGPDSDTNWIYVRGFDATQSGVYQDDLQLYGYAFGSFFIDSYLLERIEVLKGPASVLYGGSNPGGIVNYVSKRPTGDTVDSAEAGIDNFGQAYLGFDLEGKASDTVDYRVVGRVFGGDGYSDFEEQFRGVISPSVTWKPDEATSLTILANYTYMDKVHNGGSFLPYSGTVVDRVVGNVNYGRIARDANFTEPDVDDYQRRQGSIGYEFEHTFDNDWTVRQNARYSAASIEEANLYPNGWASATELARVNFAHDTTAQTFLLDNQVQGKFETGAVEHMLLAGIDYKIFNIDQVQGAALFGTTTPIDAFDPVYGVPQTSPVSYLNQDLTQQQLGFYVQDQLRFGGGWLVTLNGRYDEVWADSHDGPTYYAPTQDVDRDTSNGQFSGRAGLAYEFKNGFVPYASVASFFNPVIGTTSGGEFFIPETGQQYEAGVKYAPTWFDGIFTAAVFDLTRQNVPTTDPDNIFAQVQTGEVRSRGFEFEGKANVTDNIKVSSAFTAFDLEITKDTDAAAIGSTPFIVPETQASLFADYTFHDGMLKGLSLGGGVRYIGRSFADVPNTLEVPAVTLADARLGFERANWRLDVGVTNLFDKDYVSSCQGVNVCSYGEARRFYLKTKFTW